MNEPKKDRDLYDWTRIGLMVGYLAIMATLQILALTNPVYFLFNLIVMVWIIPFIVFMIIGETMKIKKSLPFWVSLVGVAIIVGIYFGWFEFFLTEDILLGVLTVILYAIIIAYIVLRYVDTDGSQAATLLILFLVLLIGTILFIVSAGLEFYSVFIIIIPVLQGIALICFAITLTVTMYLFVESVRTK